MGKIAYEIKNASFESEIKFLYMYKYNTAWPLRKLRQSILSGYKLLTWTDNDSVQKYMAPSVTR